MTAVTILHLSDLHFGRDIVLEQADAIEAALPGMAPSAIVLAGDLSQRGRHGELQAARGFADRIGRVAPVLAVPGNHDVQYWNSLFHLFGTAPLYRKYRRYFGEELSPRLEIPGARIAGALTSHGIAAGSMTWNLNDMAVKGHLPAAELERAAGYFREAPSGTARVLVMHHNLLRGDISRRMGLARWKQAQERVAASGADLVLCGHDHQEGSGVIGGGVVVSTSSTLCTRTRGHRAQAYNVVTIAADSISVQHMRWDTAAREFQPGDLARFARMRRPG